MYVHAVHMNLHHILENEIFFLSWRNVKTSSIFFENLEKNLTGRIRTIDLGITAKDIYSPPLYQLSYGEPR